MKDECPSGCGRSVGAGKLLCGPCWSQVPRDLQRAVLRTWRAYNAVRGDFGDPDYHARKRAARLEYQEARDSALGAVR